jgi:hypothetical protein
VDQLLGIESLSRKGFPAPSGIGTKIESIHVWPQQRGKNLF